MPATMNDYKRIRRSNHVYRLRPRDTLLRNFRSREFFAEAIAGATSDRIVVTTHHAPIPRAAKAGMENDLVSAAYTNGDCSDLIGKVNLWCFGHTHETRSLFVEGARVVTNAKGYGPLAPGDRWENPVFNPNFIVEV